MQNPLLQLSLSLIIASPLLCPAQTPQQKPAAATSPAAHAGSTPTTPAAAAMSKEQLQQAMQQLGNKFVASMQKLNGILDNIKDEQSAKAALQPLQQLARQMAQLKGEAEKLKLQPQFEQLDESFLNQLIQEFTPHGMQSDKKIQRLASQKFYAVPQLEQLLSSIKNGSAPEEDNNQQGTVEDQTIECLNKLSRELAAIKPESDKQTVAGKLKQHFEELQKLAVVGRTANLDEQQKRLLNLKMQQAKDSLGRQTRRVVELGLLSDPEYAGLLNGCKFVSEALMPIE